MNQQNPHASLDIRWTLGHSECHLALREGESE